VTLAVKSASPEKIRSGVVVVGAFADGTLCPPARAIDRASRRRLSAVIKRGDLDARAGASLLLHDVPGVAAQRVLLVSLGAASAFGDRAYRDALAGVVKALGGLGTNDAAVTLADVDLPGRSLAWRLQQAARILADGAYRFAAPRSATDGARRPGVRAVTLLIADKVTAPLAAAVRRGEAVAEGMALAKDLGNLPGNVCTPAYLAETAKTLGRQFTFEVEVLERADMEKLGMGSALSVGRASHEPCKFIVMHYRAGDAATRPIVLVGKGVTFDTGGISLKPGAGLDEMKFDMSGAGSVLGTMKAIARLALPINVVGIVVAVENMPGGNALRPGDVVTSMSGQTIEVLDTDAEGRLLLCDALTYAERFEPACVIDVATLTGACVTALGTQASGLFANDDALATELLEGGTRSGDRVWRLPAWDEYQDLLRSNFADMSNIGGRGAGAVVAACFLARFARAYRWAHLDIAGTASLSGDAKGSTGRPVPLLSEFVIARADGSPT
jgi:leucyl aminopeptidase